VNGRPGKPDGFLSLLELIEPKGITLPTRSWKSLLLRIDVGDEPTVVDSS
jgi:hypothetical protein